MPYTIPGDIINEGFILENDSMTVLDGGVVDRISVNDGRMYVSSGGTANSGTVNFNGWINVSNGGSANHTTVNNGGHLYVYDSGTLNSDTVNSGGTLYVFDRGLAEYATANAGLIVVYGGGSAENTTVSSGGRMKVDGGSAEFATVESGGRMEVINGGTANSDTVNSGGMAIIRDSGTINYTTVESGGRMDVSKDGTVNSATINAGGTLNVSSGGTAGDILVQEGGRLVVFSEGQITSATVRSGGILTGNFDFNVISFDSGAVLDFGVFCREEEDQGAIVKNISSIPEGVCYSITVAEDQKEGTYQLADGMPGFGQTISLCYPEIQIGTLTLDETVRINGDDYTLRLTGGELTLTIEETDKPVTQYVYLDFDGESGMRYRNSALKLSIALSVRDSGISEERRQAILSELTERYAGDGIVFTLERPEDDTDYSTLYFGKSKAFDDYGEFFGVSETHDRNNQDKNDRAFILLDQSYSDGQVVSVASHMLDHLMGYSYMADGTPELKQYAESKYLLSTEWNQGDPYNKYVPAISKKKRYWTGCTNTAAAQIINYWIEKGLLDFTLSLDASDAYEINGVTISADDNPASGHLSFAETNELLANYEPGDEDSIAALSFAVGVVQRAKYESDGTGAFWKQELFYRSGFESDIQLINHHSSGEYYWPKDAESYQGEGTNLSDSDPIIQDLLQGRPIATVIRNGNWDDPGGHSIVIDGYDSSTNKFHLNYGWGGLENGWYSLKEMNKREVYCFLTGVYPKTAPNLEVNDLTFDTSFVDRSEDATLHFSIANTGKEKSNATVATVYCGTMFLTLVEVDFVSPGSSRDLTCAVKASDLSVGENTITVKVYSQKEEVGVSISSGTIRVYDGAITDTDDTWKLAAEGGEWTRIAAEYDAEGNVAETVLAEDEYIGCRDLVDFREVTLGHAGKYTFTLSGFTNDLELAIYSLTAKNNLKLVKSLAVLAPDDTAVLSDVPLEKGTYYISVRAVNELTPGDSDYRLVFSGAGYHKADNSDDWTDLAHSGVDGAVGSAGIIDEETGEIISDGWVGLGDEFDYRLFEIPFPAKTSFTITASDAVKFTVYELQEKTSKKGVTTYSLKSLQSTKVKAGVPATTTGLLLSAGNAPGKYCFSVQSTNAAKGGSADYAVTFNPAGSEFFSKGDNSDDWADLKTKGADGAVGEACTIADGDGEIFGGWVGFGDAVDYKAFTIDSSAKLSFTLGASDATKFTVWKLNAKTDRKGVTTYSLKSMQSTKLAKNKTTGAYAATTKTLLLDEGTYYFSVESTNAKKGGSADYTVNLNADASVFYVDADDGMNNWLYTKKDGLNRTLHDSDAIVLHSGMTSIQLDRDKPDVDSTDDFVGYGDEADYLKISLETDAVLSFTATATDACKFVICSLAESTDKKGNAKYSVKTLQTTKLSKPKGAAEYAATTKALSLSSGEYYISMQSTNAKKGGAAYYNVSLNQDVCAGLPEEFEIQDVSDAFVPVELGDLNSGLFAENELAEAFAFGGFATQDFIGESSRGLLAGL